MTLDEAIKTIAEEERITRAAFMAKFKTLSSLLSNESLMADAQVAVVLGDMQSLLHNIRMLQTTRRKLKLNARINS